ncbi:MAG: phosphate acyltransferase PlsX [Gammaproteobacteria bacterium]|nr:phosphate acyltransferase PlsX [Gammaproteobacteria bacterium]
MANVTIAIDVMGGDHGPSVTIPAALQVAAKHTDVNLILVGQLDRVEQVLKQLAIKALPPTVSLHGASQVVEMDDLPSHAMKHKKDSSMRIALNLVKDGQANACVSAGNTGALMATARFVLKTLPGIERPALITAFPTMKLGTVARMLDLGANVDSSPANLLQFAVMGSVLASAVSGIPSPRIGLLNVGAEEIKGNEQVKETNQLLTHHTGLNYIGYVEGNDLYKGTVDVVVCDGFVGNVALKSSEGIASLILHCLKQGFHKNWYTKLLGLLVMPIMRVVKKHIDPANYNGACLIGLRGIVIKSHGGAGVAAFANAISEALVQARQNIPTLVSEQIAQLLNEPALQESP